MCIKDVRITIYNPCDIPNHCSLGVTSGDVTLTLEAVLNFITGSDTVTVLGFEGKPSIRFDLDSDRLLSASTCTLELTLTKRYDVDYEKFREEVKSHILNAPGFGFV